MYSLIISALCCARHRAVSTSEAIAAHLSQPSSDPANSAFLGTPNNALRAGMTVETVFDDVTLPRFRPRAG
jgi:hypothetical protein